MVWVDSKPYRGRRVSVAIKGAGGKPSAFRAVLSAKAGIEAKIALRGKAPEGAVLRAVLFQEKATTKCTAGENKGKTLHEIFVVRSLSKPLDLKAALDKGVAVKFEAPKDVKADNLGVAFLLEKGTKTIESWWTPLAP